MHVLEKNVMLLTIRYTAFTHDMDSNLIYTNEHIIRNKLIMYETNTPSEDVYFSVHTYSTEQDNYKKVIKL